MTGTLALVGGDPFDEACTFNRRLAEAAGASEVVVVPTAAAFEHPDRAVEDAARCFADAGVAVRSVRVLTRAEAMDDGNADACRNARMIYLVGTSAMHARPTLMDTPVWRAIVDAWQAGATVVGSDAGGQILGDPMVDDRGGAFTVGLGMIGRLAFVPRHETWSGDALQRMHQMTNDDVVTIGAPSRTVVVRSPDGAWTTEGEGSVTVRIGGEPAHLADVDR